MKDRFGEAHVAQGENWSRLFSMPRRPVMTLSRDDLPTAPGVYVWFRQGEPVYSGVAAGSGGLRARVGRYHLATGPDLSRSSFRRNVCEHLGVATVARAKERPSVLAAADVEPVNAWVRMCEIAWIECPSPEEAKALERALHREWLPPLSRR